MQYKVTDVLEAQYKDEIGIDIHIGVEGNQVSKEVACVKLRGRIENEDHYNRIRIGIEKLIRKHLSNINQSTTKKNPVTK
jgi:hypothetical protein